MVGLPGGYVCLRISWFLFLDEVFVALANSPQLLINALTVHVGTGTDLSGKPTSQELKERDRINLGMCLCRCGV